MLGSGREQHCTTPTDMAFVAGVKRPSFHTQLAGRSECANFAFLQTSKSECTLMHSKKVQKYEMWNVVLNHLC